MSIRFAEEKDIPALLSLLVQVNAVHHEGRPDLFRKGTKYDAEALCSLLKDKSRPILVYEEGEVLGYAFCILEETADPMLTPIKTLYIDDLCVDEAQRGKHIGTKLYRAAVALAKELGCYHVTLNVWALNDSARKFYESLGMKPLKTYMEEIL